VGTVGIGQVYRIVGDIPFEPLGKRAGVLVVPIAGLGGYLLAVCC
jgi:hypothetical protein